MHQHIILDKLHISNEVTDNFTTPGQFILEEENKQKKKSKSNPKENTFLLFNSMDIEQRQK